MTGQTISDGRATGVRRMLLLDLGLAAVVAALGVLFLFKDFEAYGVLLIGIAAVLGTSGYLALRAVRDRLPQARRMSIITGIALCVLSVPMIPIVVGLITVVAGIGLMVVVLAPERQAQ
jgi:hypothetical protein